MDVLADRLIEAGINKSPLSIALFDIDRFKLINDAKGHIYGDKVLKDVAGIIERSLRELDSAGRYGGEEFLVMLPNTDKINGILVADRVRKNMRALTLLMSCRSL